MVALLAISVFLLLPPTGSRADTQSKLNGAQAKLDRLLAKIKDESSSYGRLQADTTDLAASLGALEDRLAGATQTLAAIQQLLRSAQNELHAAQDQLNQRARTVYETGGPGGDLEFLLGSTSLSDLSDRMEFMDNVAASDQLLIDAVSLRQRDLQHQQVQMQKFQNGLAHVRQDFMSKRDALQAKLNAAKVVLDRLARDRAVASYAVQRLRDERAAEIRAAELAAALAASRWHPGAGAASIAGAFQVCPVDQPHAYVDSFGAPRYAGGYHPHAGTDIMSPRGTPIRAPFDGLAKVATNTLGGLSVKVYGRDGWVYNAHLSRMGHLGEVKAGDVVGYVGDSGDARGGATHDHFEWHPYVLPKSLWRSPYGYTSIDTAIDPYPYLNAVC